MKTTGTFVYHCSGKEWFRQRTILAPPIPMTNQERLYAWQERMHNYIRKTKNSTLPNVTY